jgi:hypothetical protein
VLILQLDGLTLLAKLIFKYDKYFLLLRTFSQIDGSDLSLGSICIR